MDKKARIPNTEAMPAIRNSSTKSAPLLLRTMYCLGPITSIWASSPGLPPLSHRSLKLAGESRTPPTGQIIPRKCTCGQSGRSLTLCLSHCQTGLLYIRVFRELKESPLPEGEG